MNLRSSVALAAMLAAYPTAAQDHRFENDPVVTVRENFVACDVLSQLWTTRVFCLPANASH